MTDKEFSDIIWSMACAGYKMFATSSFQTSSIPFLYILSRSTPIDVLFLDTGYHFPETIAFKEEVTELFGLNVIDVKPEYPMVQPYFLTDPDYCCERNKVIPLKPYIDKYDVWITGIRADQTENRGTLKEIEALPNRTIKFHPMLDWTMDDIENYRKRYDLPSHPLDVKGYGSIGCVPCTRNCSGREGRWYGTDKDECGLHTKIGE